MRLARDGIQLSFEIAGAGQPAFLFVHGLGGDRTHFAMIDRFISLYVRRPG